MSQSLALAAVSSLAPFSKGGQEPLIFQTCYGEKVSDKPAPRRSFHKQVSSGSDVFCRVWSMNTGDVSWEP